MQAVIGALRAVLGLDSTAFEAGIGQAQKSLITMSKSFQATGKQLESLGKSMSMAITAPILAAKAVVISGAANFEEGMNKVQAATGATTDQMKELTAAALTIGKSAGFGAKDTAAAMENLAKNGLDVTQILGGAADATVKLAAANGAQLEPAANVVTDTMQQFAKTAAQLPGVVDQVTGTLIASKLGFDDYRLAIGQAGGVAGKVGVTFEDFNAALAATSSSFASGSDAGTSFKTFLTKLAPTSQEAMQAMNALGLSFYDARGQMLPIDQVAQRLQNSFGKLSDKAKTAFGTQIFGTDALRTALGLAEQGAAGIKKFRTEIEKVSAADQAAVRLKGFNGAMRQLTASFEALEIAIGNSGMLKDATDLVLKLTEFTNQLAQSDPAMLKFITEAATVAAAMGPVVVVLGVVINSIGTLGKTLAKFAPLLGIIGAAIAPWVLLAAAIAAAGLAAYEYGGELVLTQQEQLSLNDVMKQFASTSPAATAAMKDTAAAANELAAGVDQVNHSNDDVDLPAFAKMLDNVTGFFKGTYNAILVMWDQLLPAVKDRFMTLLNVIGQGATDWANVIVDKLNEVRKYVGQTTFWKRLDFTPLTNDNANSAEVAGKAIAEAFNRGFEDHFFSDKIQAALLAKQLQALDKLQNNGVPSVLGPGAMPASLAPPPPRDGGGANPAVPNSNSTNLANALKRIEEEKKALDAAAAFLKTADKSSEFLLMQNADQVARIGAKTADMLKGLDPDSPTAKKILADVTALETARTAYENLQNAIKFAYSTQAQYGDGVAAHAETMRQLNAALATGILSQDAYAEAVKQAGYALADQQQKAIGAKGGLDGFVAGMQTAADQSARSNTAFSQGQQMFAQLSDAAGQVADAFMKMDGNIGSSLANIAKSLADFAFKTLVLKPIFDQIGQMIASAFKPAASSGGGGSSIFGAIVSGISSWFGASDGGATAGTGPGTGYTYATGGRPPAGQMHLVGERGPELRVDGPGVVIPSSRSMQLMGAYYSGANAAPMSSPMTSREAGDGSGGNQVISQQTNNFSVGVRGEVQAEIRAQTPKLADAGAARALSLRKRGGSYKQGFSRA